MSEHAGGDASGGLERAIESYAESEVDSLLAEAQAQARAKVRSLLADAIAERLLESAERRLQGEAPAHASATSESARAAREWARDPGESLRGPRESRRSPREPGRALSGTPGGQQEEPLAVRAQEQEGEADAGLGWYVYCIVGPESLELDDLGVAIDGSHALTVIGGEQIGAVASAVSLEEFGEVPLRERLDDLGWLEQAARAHEQVLDRVREQATVVPMRLCTVYRSEESVREMLVREAPVLEATLARLAGKTEWGVKIFVHPGELAAELEAQDAAEPEDPLHEARPGEAYLLNRRRETLRKESIGRELEERCAKVHEELAAAASEAALNRLQPAELTGHPGEMALNGVYLVEDAAVQDFAEIVEDLQERHAPGLDIELTGPWPPYNFVNSTIEVGR
jgi:hypothetical protein